MATDPTGQTTDSRDPAPGRLLLVQQFVNTADIEEGSDELSDVAALAAWLREHDLIGDGDRIVEGDVERAVAFREALRDLLDDRAPGEAAAEAVRTLNSVPSGALLRVSFDAEGTPRLEAATGGLDGALAELLSIIEWCSCDGTWQRLKVCAADSCRWVFYDRSKNRSGSWCSMSVCGNRAKARSYRARHRGGEQDAA